MRRLVRPFLGRETKAWRLLRSPRLRLRCFGDPVDCLIHALLVSKPSVRFVQVGSNDGIRNDPLWTFRRYPNWSGVLVEPVDHIFQRLRRNYAPFGPRFGFERAAIAEEDGIRAFYHFAPSEDGDGHDQVGSLDPSHVRNHARYFQSAPAIVETRVQCLTFRGLCEKHGLGAPDLVHVDAEGSDAQILRQVDLNRKPPAVLLYEHVHLEPDARAALRDRLRAHGYHDLTVQGDTLAVSRRTLEELPALRMAWRLVKSRAGDSA